MAEEQKEQGKAGIVFKHIIRVVNTDLAGEKTIANALKKIKGVGFTIANSLCNVLNINKLTKAGELSDKDVEKLNSALKDVKAIGFTPWLFNRRKDLETGEDKHILGPDLSYQIDNDIKQLKKMRCYRGTRHSSRLPVRGQRTRSNFRRNKGNVTGVKKKSKGGR